MWYVRPFPGPGGQWRISTEGGRLPLWSRYRAPAAVRDELSKTRSCLRRTTSLAIPSGPRSRRCGRRLPEHNRAEAQVTRRATIVSRRRCFCFRISASPSARSARRRSSRSWPCCRSRSASARTPAPVLDSQRPRVANTAGEEPAQFELDRDDVSDSHGVYGPIRSGSSMRDRPDAVRRRAFAWSTERFDLAGGRRDRPGRRRLTPAARCST